MRRIPNYDLYGESARPPWYDAFNFEWIPERSRPNDWHIAAHRHDALLQILYIRDGSGHVVIESEKHPLSPPCLVLLPAQTVHAFEFSPDIDGLVITVAQRAPDALLKVAAPGVLPVLQRAAVIPVKRPDASASMLMPLFSLLEQEFRGASRGRGAAGMALLVALLVHVARLSDLAAAPSHALTDRRGTLLRRFHALIAAHFREHPPVEFYAERLGVTAAQLARVCREELGISTTAVINEHLIREAQRDLVYSNLSVKQIAHEMGFVDSAYFSRYFRKQTGLTPGEFRSSAHRDLMLGS
ncbi:TPA: helix-turn-helix domain-containing protein [Burkholderia multivorans]|uniref:helix-turn-helix domain-containing protein n=1 Tax=Burkholderia multivorans TaxID=87883 RepID=UPI00158ED55F|nr:helix-turn-helix domain-containing protein [Burkholderia multivorans]MBU9316039.1 helix-turn-helix domain-containing protein [Burkholderia multivorans]HEF4741512.1 helix-turn-helix domain-containing protein [Burkholderia multivorans]